MFAAGGPAEQRAAVATGAEPEPLEAFYVDIDGGEVGTAGFRVGGRRKGLGQFGARGGLGGIAAAAVDLALGPGGLGGGVVCVDGGQAREAELDGGTRIIGVDGDCWGGGEFGDFS